MLIVDAQPTLRSSVRGVLERAGFIIAGEASDVSEAAAAVEAASPDLCLLEPLIPGGGARAISEILERSPQTAVVVLTASDDRDLLLETIRAGAAGYLLKDMNPGRIANALQGVLEGEAAIPRKLVASLVSDYQSHGRRRLVAGRDGRAELTRREWEVARLLVEGETTAAIGERLFLSPVTVRRHAAEVVRKLGVVDRAEAIELLREGTGGSVGPA